MHKASKQIFKGHITDIMSFLMYFFLFSFNTALQLCLFLLNFSLLNYDFTILTLNWEVLLLAKLGKLFTMEFLTIANTLLLQWFQYECNCTLTKFSMFENFVSCLRNKGNCSE